MVSADRSRLPPEARMSDDDVSHLNFVARRWLQLVEEAARGIREHRKARGRDLIRNCVDHLSAIGMTEDEIVRMLHGMADFMQDDLDREAIQNCIE
jgi:hypothetical protein